MVHYPATLAHGLRKTVTRGRLSKEMDSKSLAEFSTMAIIFWQGKIDTHSLEAISNSDWFHPFSSPEFPTLFQNNFSCRFERSGQTKGH